MSNSKIEQLKNLFDYFDIRKDVSIHSTEFKKFGYLIDLNAKLTKPRKLCVDCWMLIKYAKTKAHTVVLPGHRVEDIPNVDAFLLLADVKDQVRFKYVSESETNEKFVNLPSSGVKSDKYTDSCLKEKPLKKDLLKDSNVEISSSNKQKYADSDAKRTTEAGYLLKFISEVDHSMNDQKEGENDNSSEIITNEQLADEFKRFNSKHNLFLEEFSRQEKDIEQIKDSVIELVTLIKECIPRDAYLNFIQKSKTLRIEEPEKKQEKISRRKKDCDEKQEIEVKLKQSQDSFESKENVEEIKISQEKNDESLLRKDCKIVNNSQNLLLSDKNESPVKNKPNMTKEIEKLNHSQTSSDISNKILAREKQINSKLIEENQNKYSCENIDKDGLNMFDIEFENEKKDSEINESPVQQNKSISEDPYQENDKINFEETKKIINLHPEKPQESNQILDTNLTFSTIENLAKVDIEEHEVRLNDEDKCSDPVKKDEINNIASECYENSIPLKEISTSKIENNLLDSQSESKRKREKKDASKIESSQSSEEKSHKKKHKKHKKHKKSKHREKSKRKENDDAKMMKDFLHETSCIPENSLKIQNQNENKKRNSFKAEKNIKAEATKFEEKEKVYNSDDTDYMIERHLSKNRIIKPNKKDKFVDCTGSVDYYTSGLYMKREKLSPPRYDRGKDIYEKSDGENSDQGFSRPMQIDREMLELEKKNKEKTKEKIKEKNPDEFDFHSYGSGSDISF